MSTATRRYAPIKHTHTADDIEGGVSGGLDDGDYGDVTVSGSGTVITIDNLAVSTAKIADLAVTTAKLNDDAVTNAKLADMAEATVKGRAEGAGTGNPTDLSVAQLRDLLNLGALSEVRGASFVGFNQVIQLPANDVALTIKEDCTITKVVVLTMGGTGSCVVDIWKDAYASYPPTVGDSICPSNKPTISSNIKYTDSTLTGWSKNLSAGDTLTFHLESVSSFTAVFVFLILEAVGSTDADGYTDERVREIFAEEFADGGVTVISSTYNITLPAGSHEDLILWDLLGQPSGAVTVNFTNANGAIIRSTSVGNAALDLRGFTSGSTINLTNLGSILGKGGKGGNGGFISSSHGEAGGSGVTGVVGNGGTPGQDGGNAIIRANDGVTISITNAAGYIFGGGGGGAPGGLTIDFTGDNYRAAAGAGGGGAGGGQPGEPGSCAASSTTTAGVTLATSATAGGATRTSSGGSAGAGAENGNAEGGDGGAGGGWGAAGSAGSSPTGFDRDYTAKSAGAAGKAIELAGGSVTFVSGNDATHVKGAVS